MTFIKQWSDESIKVGFDRFITENGRLPTAPEVDSCDYLPSSRQIQRQFGGLRSLRSKLGYTDVDFGIGEHRRAISNRVGSRGVEAEILIENLLISKFGEVYVHIEKRYGTKLNRLDFFVFSPEGNFGVDVFYTETIRDMQKNINVKINKYTDFPANTKLIFLNANPVMDQEMISLALANMQKIKALSNLEVMDINSFNSFISRHTRFDNPKGLIQINK